MELVQMENMVHSDVAIAAPAEAAAVRSNGQLLASLHPLSIEQDVVKLYDEHGQLLLRYANSIVNDNELANEALQETFLRYFRVRSEGQAVENPRAWLFRVIRNHLFDHLKKQETRCETRLDVVHHRADPEQNPEQRQRCTELIRQMEGLLSPRELQTVRLRMTGLHYEEIAAMLGITDGTVGTLLARALKKLRPAL
jgi:RNA polymerase sigma-70 factor (ECF subfamily)